MPAEYEALSDAEEALFEEILEVLDAMELSIDVAEAANPPWLEPEAGTETWFALRSIVEVEALSLLLRLEDESDADAEVLEAIELDPLLVDRVKVEYADSVDWARSEALVLKAEDENSLLVEVTWASKLAVIDAEALAGVLNADPELLLMPPAARFPFVSTL